MHEDELEREEEDERLPTVKIGTKVSNHTLGVGHVVGINEGKCATVVYTGKAKVEPVEQVARNTLDNNGETLYEGMMLNKKYKHEGHHQYVTRKHKRKKKKGSRTTYTVIASDATSRKLRIDELVGEMSVSPSVTKMEKQRIVQTSTDSQEPRWIAKAKAKRLARAPCKNEPRSTKIHETVAAKNTHSELQAGSSAHLQNRTAAMRTRRPRAPQRGDVRDTND